MGYYTQFELKVQEVDGGYEVSSSRTHALMREIEFGAGFVPMGIFGRDYDGGCNPGVVWYYYDDLMIKFSKKYPQYTFSLYGIGEDGLSDTWVHYFQNGFNQKHMVSFPEFNFDSHQ